MSFGLALSGGILLAVLSFNFVNMTNDSTVIPPDQQELISTALEDNAELVSTPQLGFLNSFRMMRLPDFRPSSAAEGMLGG